MEKFLNKQILNINANHRDLTIYSEPKSLSSKCFEKLLHFYKPLPNINNPKEYKKEQKKIMLYISYLGMLKKWGFPKVL